MNRFEQEFHMTMADYSIAKRAAANLIIAMGAELTEDENTTPAIMMRAVALVVASSAEILKGPAAKDGISLSDIQRELVRHISHELTLSRIDDLTVKSGTGNIHGTA